MNLFVVYSYSAAGGPMGIGNSALIRDRGICSQSDVNDVQAEVEGMLLVNGISDPKVVVLNWREFDAE